MFVMIAFRNSIEIETVLINPGDVISRKQLLQRKTENCGLGLIETLLTVVKIAALFVPLAPA